jgi:hypothetical protein
MNGKWVTSPKAEKYEISANLDTNKNKLDGLPFIFGSKGGGDGEGGIIEEKTSADATNDRSEIRLFKTNENRKQKGENCKKGKVLKSATMSNIQDEEIDLDKALEGLKNFHSGSADKETRRDNKKEIEYKGKLRSIRKSHFATEERQRNSNSYSLEDISCSEKSIELRSRDSEKEENVSDSNSGLDLEGRLFSENLPPNPLVLKRQDSLNGQKINEEDNKHDHGHGHDHEHGEQSSRDDDTPNIFHTQKSTLVDSNNKTKARIKYMLHHPLYNVILTILTIYALFFDDIRLLAFTKSADDVFFAITSAAFLIFVTEICLASYSQNDYFTHFFFWLDIIATVSLIPDIGWIWDYVVSGG